ncbi:phosphotransferase family protein [Limobrevibacterium gyesilva]|uniref:Aminoglycoside phosphotransferase family protein n=1 Tax=Limobrevibacterium gyesilva TaxID=2991712 RepID=A0AA42CEJ8_9PROT|nr:aminoglycoside phosphotransferase family protein [Limobrevibacterium gyesilva]MCW3475369.1 aminoglycoside phosphotransferase family protein [Limobrevibacterium gyesilva]
MAGFSLLARVASHPAGAQDAAMGETTPPPEILDGLRRMGLLGAATPAGAPLTGGVSSDIWRIDLPQGPVCVKRALARLRVAADWRAPVGRNLYEARWMRRAAASVPGAAPALLGQDAESGSLAMQFLPAAEYRLWKTELRDGRADPCFAGAVAQSLVRIHAATAADPSVAAEFPTDTIFYDIRLEPYLVATARRHPDRADALLALVAATQGNKRALVHGDVSPKNILVGPAGPVFLDAECAWWGDPAFDLAFCLNHLLLKCLWTPAARERFLACFDALVNGYLSGVDWEAPAALEGRAARLLPGLFLARVDGKSPAEYITEDAGRDRVRRVARALLADPPDRLSQVRDAWREDLTT